MKLFDLFQSFGEPLYNFCLMFLQEVNNIRRIIGDRLGLNTSSTANVGFVGVNVMNSILDGSM